jgi:ketosteroid isomerase-like protein
MTTRPTIDELLDSICSGTGIPTRLYTDDATLDATVPGWRLQADGPAAITAEFARWFAHPGRFEELERRPFAAGDGELVTYLLVWEEDGVPHAAHHAHTLVLDAGGRIAKDTVFCGGRWAAPLLAEMAGAGR